jgi:lipopolysaccharide biosynthesis regulator YciM
VRKSQWILVVIAAAVVFLLYVYGRIVPLNTTSQASEQAAGAMGAGAQVTPAKFEDVLSRAKQSIAADMQLRIANLEKSITRGDVKKQRLDAYRSLAALWDSLGHTPLAAHYIGEEAKLENSKNSLTFAANLFLAHIEHTDDPAVRAWEADEAGKLLEQALVLNPQNDTIQVALANSEVQGGNVMQGVQRLLKITAKDPDNIPANMMLGRLSVTSGQYDKAIDRLEKVVNQQPDNTEALYFLAEAYKATGKKDKAISIFEKCKKLVNNPDFSKEIDQYINSFK